MIYSIISILCIAIMITIVVYLVAKFLKYNRSEKIEFIKTFKKGKCAIIYLVAIPLFFMANIYARQEVLYSFFTSVTQSIDLVVLKFNFSTLMSDNLFFGVSLYLCFFLVVLNAIMISVSFFHQAIWHIYMVRRFHKTQGDKAIIIGNNGKSMIIYDSCNCQKTVIGVMSKEEKEQLYVRNTHYKSYKSESLLGEWVEKEILHSVSLNKNGNQKINIIINNDIEHANLDWCGFFVRLIEKLNDDFANNLDIYVFGDRDFEDVYDKYEQQSKGCIHYVNEYRQLAIDFIDRYPLTEFMGKKHIDYTTSLINPETDINVCMVGFGRTNQQIFLSMIANNQFLTVDKEGNILGKNVTYHLFDKLHTGDHKNLNHNYFRYKYTFAENKVDFDKYLPLPESPSSEHYHYLDINDVKFYEDLKLSISLDSVSINYIIVSLGVDYASIDMANKIVTKLKEWQLTNTRVFVRIRDKKTFDDSKIFLDFKYCHPFGTDQDIVYDYSHIIQEKFTEMAIMRNYIYDIEHDMKHSRITEEERKISRLKWFINKTAIERESNVYNCLSLRNKLQLMGLDYCKKEDKTKEGLSEEKYLSIYAMNDKPDIVYDDKGNAKAIKYSLEYKDSRRKTMAMQEHQRWNAFMIMKGFIPATKDEILNETDKDGKHTNGKNYAMRHHGNLTTFRGLETFRKILAKRDSVPEENYDVIKYDYQLLDGAWWLLDKNGFKIIER